MGQRVVYRTLAWLMVAGLGLVLLCSVPGLLAGGWWLLCVPVLAALALLLWHGLKRLSGKGCTIAFCVSLAAWLALLLVLGRALRLEHTWDFGRVYEGAVELAQTGGFAGTESYYWESPHNLPVTLVLALWFKAAGLAGVHPMTAGITLNALALAASVGLLFLAVRRLWGAQKALFACCLGYLFSPMVLYVPVFYTDTLSMPFVCFLLWAAAMAQTAKTTRARVLWGVGAGLAAGVGYLMKATVLIAAVALLIGALLRYKKQALAFGGAVVLAAAVVIGGWQLWFSRTGLVNRDQVAVHRLPAAHFVMMGLKGNGGYNEEDHFFSAGFEGTGAKQAAALDEIAHRLEALGPLGLMRHLQQKLAYTWGDGTYFAPNKLAQYPVYDTPLHRWVLPGGRYYPIYHGLAQAAQALLLLLLFAGTLRQALHAEPTIDLLFVSKLSLFGLALFLAVWETRSRYLVNSAPLLVLCGAFALVALYDVLPRFWTGARRLLTTRTGRGGGRAKG